MAKFKNLLLCIAISFIPTMLLWLPFFLRLDSFWTIPLPKDGMATIVANYDGPLYIAVAKSFYNPEILSHFNFSLPVKYFAAHFPLFPLLIRLFSYPIGFPYASLVVTIISSIISVCFFSKFISDFVEKKDVYWMTLLFAIFPARWLIVRSIASPEPLFVSFVIMCLYYFRKEKYLFSGIFGALATFTKSPGILLFPAIIGAYFTMTWIKTSRHIKGSTFPNLKIMYVLPLLLIPLSLLTVFVLYQNVYGDFFAYFHSGDNIHLFFPPFQIFNSTLPWVGTFWLEDIIFIYLFILIGIFKLAKKDIVYAWFCVIFFLTTLFIAHRDLMRYSIPLIPFVLAGYSDYLVKKEFKIAFYFILIPIFLFSISFISKNLVPISDWGPLL